MKKFYLPILSILLFAVTGLAQTTVTINCTGTAGSFNSGYVNSTGAIKSDGNLIVDGNNTPFKRGWASFNLSSIPAGSIINSVTLKFTVTSPTPNSSVANGIFGFFGTPSSIAATTLYANCGSGTNFNNSAWNQNAVNSLGFNAAGLTFITGALGGNANIGFVRGNGTAIYNIAGYPAAAASQPQLVINYSPSYRSQFISMNSGSSTWCKSDVRNITVTVKNIGTATWTSAGSGMNIGLKWDEDPDYGSPPNNIPRQPVQGGVPAGPVAPGATVTYTFPNVAASQISGTNHLTFDVVREGVCWFADPASPCDITNSRFISSAITVSGPTASAGSALTAICQGGTSAALGGSVGGTATGGTWSNGGIGGTFSPSATTLNATWKPPVTYTGTATLTLTTSGGSCGTTTASKTESVNAPPTSNAGAALGTICQGGTSAGLGGSVGGTATGGTWSTPAGGSFNPNPNTLNATWTPPAAFSGTAILTLTTSGGSPCTAATSSKNQVVTASATANAGADLSAICQGGTTGALGGSVGGSATGGTWSDGGIGGTFSPNANALNATWTPPASYNGTATLTLTATGGCGSPTDIKSQIVNAGVSGVAAGPAFSTICLGSTVPLVGTATLSGSSASVIDNFNGTPTFTETGSSSGNRSQVWQQEVSGSNLNGIATFTSPGGGGLMISAAGGSGIFDASSVSSILTSAVLNTTGFSSLSTLTFNHTYRQGNSSGSGLVQVSTNGGSTWTTLTTFNSNQGSSASFTAVSINFAPYVNMTNLQIRFNFNTANQNFLSNAVSWWAIDDIILNGVRIPLYSWTASTASNVNGLPANAGTPSASNKNVTVKPTATTSYTLIATNPSTNCGATATPVVVNVNPAPTLVAPPDANLNTSDDGKGNCSTVYNWTHPSVNTLCPTTLKVSYSVGRPAPSSLPSDGTVTAGSAASAVFSTGVTIVTYTATDQNNNSANTSFIVSVTDDELPSITCPADIVVNNAAGQCNATITLAIPATGDNCGVASVTNDHPSHIYPTGTTEVTWTVVDNNDNTQTCIQKVTVKDNESPTITCNADVTVNNDLGVCSAAINLSTPATNDNCGVASVINDHSSSNIFPVGVTVVKWTVTDNAGNIATCNQTVTVTDNEPPKIICPASITTVTDAGVSYATITLQQPVVTDNCGTPTVLNDHSSSDHFSIGTTLVTWTATDIHGNSNNCIQTIVVNDTIQPSIAFNAPVNINNNPGLCLGSINVTYPEASDNSGHVTVTSDYGGLSTASIDPVAPLLVSNVQFPVGATTIVWTATDPSSNTTSSTQTVTVVDNEKPMITCPGDISKANDAGLCSAVIDLGTPVTSDNCGVASVTNDHPSHIFTVGETIVTWTVTDIHGNMNTCTQKVTVTDTQLPTIAAAPDVSVNNDNGQCAATITLTAPATNDNCGVQNITNDHPSTTFIVGTTMVTWTVTDIHGNSNTTVQKVVVTDNEKPVITVADVTVSNDAGICAASVTPLATATDNCSVGTPTGVRTDGFALSDPYPVGTTTITWNVSDVHGNAASPVIQSIIVKDNELPVVRTQDITVQLDATGHASITPAQIDNGSTDNCGLDTKALDINTFSCSNVGSPVSVTLTVTDIHGNAASATAVVTVEDNVPPVVITQNIIVQLDAAGHASINADQVDNGSTDNCDIATRTIDFSNFDCTNVDAPVTVTLTVTDVHSNHASATAIVTVKDYIAPVVATQDITVQLDATGHAFITPAQIDNGSSDNCGIDTRTLDITTFDCSNVGAPVTVTLTVTDIHGNAVSKTATVTVEDKVAPVVITQDITVQLDATGHASITPAQIDNGSTDNCAINTRALDITNFNCSNVGTPVIVTLTITDSQGNAASKTAVVTVEDKVAPVVVTQDITVQLDATGHASITTDEVDNGSSDNCGIATRMLDISNFDCSNVDAPVTVTLNVTDIHGNIASKTAIVTVEDKVAPVVVTQNITVQVDATGQAFITPDQINNGSSDACGIATKTLDISNFDCSKVGSPVTVTLSVTDIHGNAASNTALVTVLDTIAPVITASPDISVNNDAGKCGAVVAIIAATATDNCTVGAVTGTRSDALALTDLYPLGSTTITWTVNDAHGNAAIAKTQTITVTDNEKPTITTTNVTVNNDAGVCTATVTLVAPVTGDNCGVQNVSNDHPSTTYPFGTTTVTWTVTDIHGNSNTAIQTVTVNDNEKPTITAAPNVSVNNDAGVCTATVTLAAPVTADNCGVQNVSNDHPSTTYPVGTTTVTWTVTDIHGNSNTAIQTVTVNDNEKPTITAAPNVSVNNDAGVCTATVTLAAPVTADNCGVQSVTNDHPSTNYLVGTTTVTWTVTDIHGSTNTAIQTVTVTDNEKPTITPAANVAANNDLGLCSATVKLVQPGTRDNCGVLNVTNDHPSTTFPVGTTIVTWTVTDIHNNSNSATQTVTVTDNEKPVIKTCAPSVSVAPNNAGCTFILLDYRSAVTVTDNCSNPVTLTQSPVAGALLPVGLNTITITARDAVGNVSTCNFIVTVNNTLDVAVANSNPQLYYGYSLDQSAVIKGTPTGGAAPYKIVITMNRILGCNAVTSTGDEIWTASGGSTVGNTCPISGTAASIPVSTITNVPAGGSYFVTATLMANAVFTITVTDANGCTVSKTTTVHSEDDRCFAGNSGNAKVKICHRTGNPNDPCHELCVDESAVAAHLAHGDFLGSCTPGCVAPVPYSSLVRTPIITGTTTGSALEVKVLPNPTSYYFTIGLQSVSKEKIKITVVDVLGRVMEQRSDVPANSTLQLGNKYHPGIYIAEIMQGKDKIVLKLIKEGK